MELYHYSPSEAFVMLTVDQFVERDDGPLEQQGVTARYTRSGRLSKKPNRLDL